MASEPMNMRASAKSKQGTDHRTRVGQRRRAQTRTQIVTAALGVFAEKGPDAPVIDDFIKAAGVARGTFYNHFASTEELLDAASKMLEDNVMRWTLAAVGEINDPALRFATGVRLWLRWSQADKVGCGFVVRSRFRGPLVERQLAADLKDGLDSGKFSFTSVQVARDLSIGTILEAMRRLMTSRVPKTYTDDVTRVILQGVGADKRTADRLMAAPLPPIKLPVWGPEAAQV
jgi:AcrR family transcriptional regulator